MTTPGNEKFFKVYEDDDSKIDYEMKLILKKQVRDQKGAKGMIYMLISAVCFSLMAFLLKTLYINSNISTFEVTYWQSLMMGVFNFSLFKLYQKDHLDVPYNQRRVLVLRSVFAFFGMIGYYLALEYTDLAKATTLYWTNPVFTAVISYFVINEHLCFIDWVAIFVSFFGILVIENPWSLEALAREKSEQYSITTLLGSLAAIGGALSFSVSQMQTRKLGKKVHFLVPPFYQAIFSAFVAPLIMFIILRYRQSTTTTYGWYEAWMLLLISLSLFVAQVFQTKAYQNDKAGRVAPVQLTQIIFNYIFDYAVLQTQPSYHAILGGILIIGSNFVISFLRLFNIIK